MVVNVLNAGIIPGTGGHGLVNADKLNQLASRGESLYFPGGHDYEIHGMVRFHRKERIVVRGDGPSSRILQLSDRSRTFEFDRCQDVLVQYLYLVGRNVTKNSVETVASGSRVNLARAFRCKRVIFEKLWGEGCAGHALQFLDVMDGDILHCKLWNNIEAKNSDPADISVDSSAVSAPRHSCEISIIGNKCLSNSRVGIDCSLSSVQNAVINSNQVVAKDANLIEVSDDNNIRKDAIVIQYRTEDAKSDEAQHLTVNGNLIKNARWNGIYAAGANNRDNRSIKASIVGNVIRNVCLAVADPASPNLQGGISCRHLKRLTIAGNTITQVHASDSARIRPTAAVRVSAERDAGKGPVDGVVTISGNTIADCAHDGIVVWGEGLQTVVVSGNSVCEVGRRAYWAWDNPPARSQNISGNTFQSSTPPLNDSPLIVLDNSARRDEPITFVGNLCQQTGARSRTSEVVEFGSSHGVFTGNTIIGDDTSHAIGVTFAQSPVRGGLVIAHNRFSRCHTGIGNMSGGRSDPPLIHDGSQFEDVGRHENDPHRVLPGQYQNGRIIAYADAAPSKGAWEVGDRVENVDLQHNPSVLFWHCVAAGTPGRWVAVRT